MFGAIAKGIIEGSLGNILDKLVPDREGRKKFDVSVRENASESRLYVVMPAVGSSKSIPP